MTEHDSSRPDPSVEADIFYDTELDDYSSGTESTNTPEPEVDSDPIVDENMRRKLAVWLHPNGPPIPERAEDEPGTRHGHDWTRKELLEYSHFICA